VSGPGSHVSGPGAPEAVPHQTEARRPRGRPRGAADRGDAPQRLTAALVALRWDRGVMGAAVGRSRQVVASWCDGRGICPPGVLAWAERMARAMRDDPPPRVGG
jgi:hypothetical protein